MKIERVYNSEQLSIILETISGSISTSIRMIEQNIEMCKSAQEQLKAAGIEPTEFWRGKIETNEYAILYYKHDLRLVKEMAKVYGVNLETETPVAK